MKNIKKIFSAKTYYNHIFFWIFMMLAAEGLLVAFLLPALFLAIFGDGTNYDSVAELSFVKTMEDWLPLLSGLFFLLARCSKSFSRRRFSGAKSYIIVMIVLLCIYPFRWIIIHFIGGLLVH